MTREERRINDLVKARLNHHGIKTTCLKTNVLSLNNKENYLKMATAFFIKNDNFNVVMKRFFERNAKRMNAELFIIHHEKKVALIFIYKNYIPTPHTPTAEELEDLYRPEDKYIY